MRLSTALHRIGFWITAGTVFLIPLFFLPLTSDFYEFNKQALLIVSVSLLLIIWTVSSIVDHQVRFTRSPFGLPLLALCGTWLLSTYLQSPNRFDALLEPGQTGTILALSLFFLISINFLRTKKDLEIMVMSLIGSMSVLALAGLIWYSDLITKILPWAFMKSPIWTPTGNPISSLVILVSVLPFLGFLIAKDKSTSTRTLINSVSLFIVVVSCGLIIYRTFLSTTAKPVFLSQSASWAVALESLKNAPLLGTGPSTYLSSFTRFKPVSFNQTPFWATRFASSSNYYLQLLSTTGILGLLSFIFFGYKIFSLTLRSFRFTTDSSVNTLAQASSISASVLLISLLFLPPGVVTLFLLFAMALLVTASFKVLGSSLVRDANIDIVAGTESGDRSPILPWISLIVSLAIILPVSYFSFRAYLAEYYFRIALQSASNNSGKATYDNLIAAMKANPYRDAYRVAYSQTNLLLANSLASKPGLTDGDRNTITQLVQQSIQEAKNAVALNPNKVTNVENLAGIYQNLLSFAQGADTWTIASYQQAITLDPTNPNLRISLGGIYYSLKDYDNAVRTFQQAVDLKPDLANAHYNLASAYREKGDYQQALTSMQTVLNLLDKTSPDYTKAQTEAEAMQKKIGVTATPTPAPVAPAQTQLESPRALPTPRISPPIKLPSDLGPQTTPAVTPAPTGTTSPQTTPNP